MPHSRCTRSTVQAWHTACVAPAALALSTGLMFAAAAPAHAVTLRPGQTVVDEADVLSPSEESELTGRIDELRRTTGQNLHVVYVDSFPTSASDTVEQIARQARLGSNDSVLAVATEDRQYQFDVHSSSSFADQQSAVNDAYIAPVLPSTGDDDWSAPGLAAVEGVDDAADGRLDGEGKSGAAYQPAGALPEADDGGAGVEALTGVLGLAALASGGYLVYRMTRGADARDGRRGKQGAGSSTGADRVRHEGDGRDGPRRQPDPLDSLSIDELRAKAGSRLVAADDAIRSSEQELAFAEAAYGEDAVVPFREDIAAAKEHMRASFRLQHQLDDEIPDSEADQRSWLTEIIGRSRRVDESLKAHQEQFNELRGLEKTVPDALERIDAELPRVREQVEEADRTLVRLHGEYADSALEEVSDNATQARERLEFVETAEQKARQAWQDQDRPTAALAVRTAEQGLAQTRTLVSAVAKADEHLRGLLDSVRQGLGQSEQDVAEAEAVVRAGGETSLAGPAAGLRTVVEETKRALSSGRPDPQALLHRLEDAHRQLSVPLGGVRGARAQARQAAQLVPGAVRQAQSRIDGTTDFIAARRGGVGPEARGRLSEAERVLDEARALTQSDPARALEAAQHASHLAERASELARRDVASFDLGHVGMGPQLGSGMRPGGYGGGYGTPFGGRDRRGSGRSAGASFGGGLGGALLGGLIVNSMLGGSGDWSGSDWGGGGFGDGGLTGGDFGGFGDGSGGTF